MMRLSCKNNMRACLRVLQNARVMKRINASTMHTHHPHPHELAAGADGMGTALRSTGQELKLRGDYGAARISRVQREDAPRLYRAKNVKRSAPGLYRIDTPDEGRELRMAAGISAPSKQERKVPP